MSISAAYVEIDKFACDWLRELIKTGHITDGEVFEESLEDLRPCDLARFTRVHLCAGIAIWDYALNKAGWGERPVWTMSLPCQPFSAAGKNLGFADERHIWPSALWLVQQSDVDCILGEQVANKDGLAWFDAVSVDLEAEGYAVGAVDLCAAGFGAPHIRQRNYWCAIQGRTLVDPSCEQVGFPGRARLSGGSDGARLLANSDSTGQTADGRDASQVSGIQEAQCESEHGAAVPRRSGGISRHPHCESGSCCFNPNECDGNTCWLLANDAKQGRIARRRLGKESDGQDASRIEPGRLRDDRQLGKSDSSGSFEGEQASAALGHRNSAISTSSDRQLGDNDDQGLAQRSIEVEQPGALRIKGSTLGETGLVCGRWAGADWIFCRDGKWRPVEPGTFPLVTGHPNRVGLLRGYGNALCAPVAQGFVEAVMDVLDEA